MKGYEILKQRLPRHIQIEWVKECVRQNGEKKTIKFLDKHFYINNFVHLEGFVWTKSIYGYKYWDRIYDDYFLYKL